MHIQDASSEVPHERSSLLPHNQLPPYPTLPGKDTQTPTFTSTRWRWYILASFSLATFMQGTIWITYSTTPDVTKKFYTGVDGTTTVTDATICLLLNYGPICALVGFLPFMWLLSTGSHGFRLTTLSGVLLTAAGGIVRALPVLVSEETRREHVSLCLFLAHLGQILNGLAGPPLGAAPTTLSTVWFPPHERAVATALAYMANTLGPALSFLFALPIGEDEGLFGLLLAGEGCVALLSALLLLAHFPAEPPHPPSMSAHARRESAATPTFSLHSILHYGRNMCRITLQGSFLPLLLAAGNQAGAFNMWSASLPVILQHLTEAQCQWLGFATSVANNVGILLAGPLSVRCFYQRYKLFLIVLLFVSLLSQGLFTLANPNLLLHDQVVFHMGFTGLCVSICVFSLFLGASNPVFFEFGAEMTFPEPEGTSAGIIVVLNNLAAFLGLWLMAVVPGSLMNAVMWGSIVLCLGLVALVREKYSRTSFDLGLPNQSQVSI